MERACYDATRCPLTALSSDVLDLTLKTRVAHGGMAVLEGSPLQQVLRLSWPVILSQLLVNAVNIVDLIMLGRLGTQTLAAVGYAMQCLFVVQSSVMAVGAACVAMMSRSVGGGHSERARAAFATNLLVGVLGFALPLMLLALLAPVFVLNLLAVPQSVLEIVVPYFRWTLSASLPVACCVIYDHAFRSVRDTVQPMRITVAVSIAKVALNYVLIFGVPGVPALGLLGAGVATVLAHSIGAVLFIYAANAHHHEALRLSFGDMARGLRRIGETLRLSLPALGERMSMTLALMVYFRFLAHYDVAAIAAYNVGVRVLAFTWIPGIGLGVAASTLVGQALGARDPRTARQSGGQAVRLGLMIAVTLGMVFVLLRQPISLLFTNDDNVIAALDPFLLFLAASLPFLVTHFALAGALRGAGDTLTPLYASAVGSWVIRVPLGYVFSSVVGLPLIWVWSILLFDHLTRAIWLTWVFRRGRWHQRLGDD